MALTPPPSKAIHSFDWLLYVLAHDSSGNWKQEKVQDGG